jgi:ribonuclease HII
MEMEGNTTKVTKRVARVPLESHYDSENEMEIGVDEAGRGPLFGRLYVAAVVLPKDTGVLADWRTKDIRDSKKYSSKKKIADISKYIRETAHAYNIQYIEADEIDRINIRQAVLLAMHRCVGAIRDRLGKTGKTLIVVDGCDFTPHMEYDEVEEVMREVPSVTVEGGDGKYMCIAAASILAKVARDEYIGELCAEHPFLAEQYGLDTNMGYGTKAHLDGIRTHGISQWHRRTFGDLCKNSVVNPV